MSITSGHTSLRTLSPSECRLTLFRLVLRLGATFATCSEIRPRLSSLSSFSSGPSFLTSTEKGHSAEIFSSFSLAQNILYGNPARTERKRRGASTWRKWHCGHSQSLSIQTHAFLLRGKAAEAHKAELHVRSVNNAGRRTSYLNANLPTTRLTRRSSFTANH